MRFWDYGNAFLLECRRAGADVDLAGDEGNATRFKYPSYVQDIMGYAFPCYQAAEEYPLVEAFTESILQRCLLPRLRSFPLGMHVR